MIRLFFSLTIHLVLQWNARVNAAAQRHAAAHAEEDMLAYRAGIPRADESARHLESRVREIKAELRARKLARLFG